MPHKYRDAPEKRQDFWLAFFGWFVANFVLVAIVTQLPASAQPIAVGLLLALNVAVPIALAFLRAFAALGLVTAFAAALVATVLAGIFFTLGDFVAIGVHNLSGAVLTWLLGAAGIIVLIVFVLRLIHRAIK